MARKSYHTTITISRNINDKINKALNWTEGNNIDDRMDEDDKYSLTAKFPDGYEMDVEVCGVQYEEGAGHGNSAWTQAVLFNPRGGEVCHTEVEEEFLGVWCLEANDTSYFTRVEVV